MKKLAPYAILALLLAAGFSLATLLQGRADSWRARGQSNDLLNIVLGDWRRMFADQFFVQADVSFHSGYYPSIFDQARAAATQDTRHLTAKDGEPAEEEHEKQMQFLGPPRDWIERFGRHFMITTHTHLHGKNEREILPWLEMSAELDPHRTDTYAVAAYWLRDLGKISAAEQFLRQGLLNNPDSYDLFFDMGTLYYKDKHDPTHARKFWLSALREWANAQAAGKKPDPLKLADIAVNLARLEENEGNLARAIDYLELSKKGSPHPEALQKQIDALKHKLAASPPAPSPLGH